MNSKIAVIMPVYNAGKFLKGSIESVLTQKFKDISLICIDDLSTDDSSKIIEEYSKNDSRVIYLKNDENFGPSITRNRGLDYVYENMPNVEYITFVDSDDKIDENTFEKSYKEAKEHDVDILNYNFIANTYWNYDTKAIWDVIEYDKDCLNAIFDRENFYTFVVCWSKLYKKYLLKDIRFGDYKFFEDGAFAYKTLARAKNIRAIPDIFYIYNIENPNSTCSKLVEKDRIDNIFKVIRDTLEDWDKLGIKDKFENKFIDHIFLYISLVCPNILADENYSEQIESLFEKGIIDRDIKKNTKSLIKKMTHYENK